MDIIQLKMEGIPVSPRVVEDAVYPNIDSTYTEFTYKGQRLNVRTNQIAGVKQFGITASRTQGFAVYGDIAVRVAAESAPTMHYVYSIGPNGFAQIASFVMEGLGHANALQFAPVLEGGQTLPYLYVAGLSGKCYVLSFNSSYQPTLVQTITAPTNSQVLMGDDGYIWSSMFDSQNHRVFSKYRHVAVSEGDVTLTDADLVDTWATLETFDSTYTAQGWKIKFGKIWFTYGASLSQNKRGFHVYDIATHECVAVVDLSSYDSEEWEDMDFYDNAILVALYNGPVFIVRT